ncbi:WD40-repeat-containing domain protein [Dactylonectria estremocensis]|uniref:WD40-repeat-containing domain protein n=1 Tax=Dactylonectria estremocensis TaxID=1079267 RepID=A0A9P9EFT8_9HYPO|nr:WD40-repeat-containing domain protein [Dactylonectria estremocensis]
MDDDRLSASSAESDRGDSNENDNDADEIMEDAEDVGNDNDADADADDDENNDDDEDDGDNDGDADGDADGDNDGDGEGESESQTVNTGTNGDIKVKTEPGSQSNGQVNGETNGHASARVKSATPAPPAWFPRWPVPSAEVMNASVYDIVPTMAAPQSTSVNAMAITPDLRYWITGGSDGYIRKYDGPNTINGKLALTVAQRHPFVDSVTKAAILMSYWENEEPAPPGRGDQEHILSPVYSLAVHSEALWLLSGLESGGINLQSVRHDEGKRICCLQQHTNAVSVLTLAQDEKSVLSGSWDKNMFDWDLNTGQTMRSFDGSGGQISAIELRPANGAPIPDEADEPLPSTTITTNNTLPPVNGTLTNGITDTQLADFTQDTNSGDVDAQGSPADGSLFGGSDAGSLFGDTAGDQPFGRDEDEYSTNAMGMMPGHEHDSGMDHSADMAMASLRDPEKDPESESAPAVQLQVEAEAMEIDAPSSQLLGESQPAIASHIEPVADANHDQQHQPSQSTEGDAAALKRSQSPSAMLVTEQTTQQHDPTQTSSTTFLSAAIDGTLRVWDRRVPNPVARIGNRPGVPPWCMGTCWSPDGNMIYAGRRNGTVEEFDIRKAKRGWEPERVLKLPGGSGAVSAVRPMVNGRHLVCASYDILRLYDLKDTRSAKHSSVPFLIIPGPPRAGVISGLYLDPTSRFMLSSAGTRGWEGTSTEVLIGYEINVSTRE